MACDKLTALYEPTQNGNSEKITVVSQANIFCCLKQSIFHRNRSADICLLMQGLDRWAIISLGHLNELSPYSIYAKFLQLYSSIWSEERNLKQKLLLQFKCLAGNLVPKIADETLFGD